MRDHHHWLLVLDNLEPAAQEAVKNWLPPGLPGHLLATSRAPMWSTRLGLEPLPLELAKSFLLERTGQTDGEAASAVAEALGCLPLALEQAAAYLEVSGRDPASYAELLRTRLVELMEEGRPEDYPRPVATTLRLSFERMEGERPMAAALLRLCSFLAPDDIPLDILVSGASQLPDELRDVLADDIELDRTIAALRRYSLIERQHDGLRVHRLVQAVVRESLGVDQRDTWLSVAVRLLRAGFPDEVEEHPELWPLCARLLAHAQVAGHLAADQTVEPSALSWVLDRVGRYLEVRSEFRLARPLFERALAIREQVLGSDHPDTAESLNDLGNLLREQGELDAARPLSERALAIRERVLGPDHPQTAWSLQHMGMVLRGLGQLAAARPLYERALAIRERVLGPDHLDTAESLDNLALLLVDEGALATARPLYERALAIRRQLLGAEHPYTAFSLHNLGVLLQAEGELVSAGLLYERALAIRERSLGADNHFTARSMHRLATVLREQGELVRAKSLQERSLAILERVLGPGHHWTIESRRSLEEISADLIGDRSDVTSG